MASSKEVQGSETATTFALSRRSLITSVAAAGGVATVAGLLAACGGSDDGQTTPTGGATDGGGTQLDRLVAGLPSSISSLDASREAGIVNYVAAMLVQESLLGVGADGSLQPAIAESWELTDDTTYVFKIRQGVTFSDGTPLTADDVVASIEYNSNPDSTSAFAYAYASVTSVKATGDDEVTVTINEPNATFIWTLTPTTLLITSAAFLKEHGEAIGTPQVGLLGTGPYEVTEFAPDSHAEFKAVSSWWGGDVAIETVRLDFITSESTRLMAMRQGDINLALNVPADQLSEWESLENVKIETTTDRSFVGLSFDISKAPWDDVYARLAVAQAMDREGIVQSLLRGEAEVATTIPAPESWGDLLNESEVANLYASIPPIPFNMELAKQARDSSKLPAGFKTSVTYPNSGPQIGKALLTLAENLKQIDIELEVKEVTLEEWISTLGTAESGLHTVWYFATIGDPNEFVQLLLNGSYAVEGGPNIARYNNKEVNKLLDAELTSTDPVERADNLGQALIISGEEIPYLPMWWGQSATAFGPGVQAPDYGPYFFLSAWPTEVTPR